jgi:hypothetical protein
VKQASSSTTLAFLMLLMFGNVASAGAGQPVAVVSTLSGDVTVARSGGSVALKFKDEAFSDDIIRTADQSTVRLLLRAKALLTVQQRSVLTLAEEQGNLTVRLETGQIGVSVAGQRLQAGEVLQIETPNVQAAFARGNVVVNTSKSAGGVQTTVYVMDGSVDISLRGTTTRRSVKIAGPHKLTVVGKALGNPQALSAAQSTQLLAELRATAPQHLNNTPPQIERVIVKSGRAEAVKQAKLVAKQVKEASGASQGSESSRDRQRPDTGTGLKGSSPDTGKAAGKEPESKTDPGSGGTGSGGSGSTPSSFTDKHVAVGARSGGPTQRDLDAARAQRSMPVGSGPSAATPPSAPPTMRLAPGSVTRQQVVPTQLPSSPQQVAPKSAR